MEQQIRVQQRNTTQVATRVFVIWSGNTTGKPLGEALKDLLSESISELRKEEIFISTETPKGIPWFDTVQNNLAASEAAIVCMTREALRSGWIHFEAGAVYHVVRAKHDREALFTYLFRVRPEEVGGPLNEFQHTSFDRADTERLVLELRRRLLSGESAGSEGDEAWRRNFDKKFGVAWKKFEKQALRIRSPGIETLVPGFTDLFQRKTFNEPMAECSEQSWLARYEGVVETRAKLKEYFPALKLDGSYKLDIFEELLAALDIYTMNLRATTLTSGSYEFKTDGRLELPPHVENLCEGARQRVRTLVTRLMLKEGSPVLTKHSRMYAKLKGFRERKELIIHPFEAALNDEVKCLKDSNTISNSSSGGTDSSLDRGKGDKQDHANHNSDEKEDETLIETLSANRLRLLSSHWNFDRIALHLFHEHCELISEGNNRAENNQPKLETIKSELFNAVNREFELIKSEFEPESLVPLYYALRVIKKHGKGLKKEIFYNIPPYMPEISLELSRINKFVNELGSDRAGRIVEVVQDICSALNLEIDDSTICCKKADV